MINASEALTFPICYFLRHEPLGPGGKLECDVRLCQSPQGQMGEKTLPVNFGFCCCCCGGGGGGGGGG